MAVYASRREWSVADYERMLETGILTENDRVELLDGEIVKISPIGSRHAACVNRLVLLLIEHVGRSAIVAAQNPVRLSDYSEPQPDLSVCRAREDFYASSHPEPEDVLLLVEVADSSLMFDREEKSPLYAAAGIPELWIVDLAGQTITVYGEPGDATYRAQQQFGRGQTLVSRALPELKLPVDLVLGEQG
jgi:Uma2 family endonuclease